MKWPFFIIIVDIFRGNMVDAFRTHIMQTKELGTCPVRQIGGCSFFYMRISNVYIVIVVSSNANVACAFKFVVEVPRITILEITRIFLVLCLLEHEIFSISYQLVYGLIGYFHVHVEGIGFITNLS